MAIKPHAQRNSGFWTQAITPSDVEHIEDRFDNRGLDVNKMVFQWNDVTGFWEVYEPNGGLGQVQFRRNPVTGVWLFQG